MSDSIPGVLGRRLPVLAGVIHLRPLPGSPRAQAGPSGADDVARAAMADARALADAGFDLALLENFGDAPFFASKVPPITVSAMTACALAVRDACPALALGVNVLRNDAEAALAIACVVGASCIRVNVHTGARVTDQGIVEGRAAETLRARRTLGAEHVRIWADVDVKHSAPVAPVPLEQEVADLVARGLADGVLVTGEGTGRAVDLGKLGRVKRAAGSTPVLVASGTTAASLAGLKGLADGVIVGSALRADGLAGGPVDASRAFDFARAFGNVFGRY